MVLLDLDDFCEGNSRLHELCLLRRQIPGFKVTLFTIVGRCSPAYLSAIASLDWIDLVPHGEMHETSRECQGWTYDRSVRYLDWVEPLGLTRGFKAPGWQISDGMYQALLERDWWVADQEYNDGRRPAGLRNYVLGRGENVQIHGHVGHLGGHNLNELEFITEQILSMKGQEFGFVKDFV